MSENRQNIIDATQRLLQTHGLARLTTRAIAREAKVAEGLIYHHFKDKAELIYETSQTMMSETKNILQNLPLQVGTRTLPDILEDALYSIYRSHHESVLIICSIFSDNQLRARMQEIIKERNIGPQSKIEGLSAFLEAEQRLGRFSDSVDPQVAARCLWMMIIQWTMADQMVGRKPDKIHLRKEIRRYLQTLMNGFAPSEEAEESIRQRKVKTNRI